MISRCTKLIFLTTLIHGLTTCGLAQTVQTPNSPEGSGGWVVAAYVGGARTAASALNVSQPELGNNLTFEDVRLQSRSFDPPLYYGLRGSYFLPRIGSLGVEAEFSARWLIS